METVTLHLDEATLACAKRLAARYRCSIEELVRKLVSDQAAVEPATGSDLIGYLADEPDLADKVMEDVYRTRATQTLRTPTDGSCSS